MSIYSTWEAFKKDLKLTNKKIGEITGNTGDSIEAVTSRRRNKFPRWAKLAVWVWEQNKNKEG